MNWIIDFVLTTSNLFRQYSSELKGSVMCSVVFNMITLNTQSMVDTIVKGFIGMVFSVGTFLIINYIKKKNKSNASD
jgi:hypothetical protein